MKMLQFQKFGMTFKNHSFIIKKNYNYNMSLEKKIIIAFVIIIITFLLTFTRMNYYKNLAENQLIQTLNTNNITLDSLRKLLDSVDAENYSSQIELNRYKIAYEIFMKRNPKAASQYGDIISEETE